MIDLATLTPALLLLALKATGILAVAGVAGRLLPTAAQRHLAWWLALVGIAVLPLASAIVPAWPVALPEAIAAATVSAVPTELDADAAAVVPQRSTWTPPLRTSAAEVAAELAVVETARLAAAAPAAPAPRPQAAGRVATTPAPRAPAPAVASGVAPLATVDAVTASDAGGLRWATLAPAAAALWLAGIVALLVSLAVAVVRRGRLARTAMPVDGPLARQLDGLVAELGLARRPRLLAHRAAAVPVTWGLLRPTILVPTAALRWPDERRRDVLLHELAHVRRGDHAAELLAQLAAIVHWFNPLAWRALHHLRTEAELACDDAVLAAGSRATSYADHLLAAARFGRDRRVPAATVAMARRPQLGARIRAILDPRRRRRPLAPAAAIVFLAVAALLVGGLAAVSFAAPPADGEVVADDRAGDDRVHDGAETATPAPHASPSARARGMAGVPDAPDAPDAPDWPDAPDLPDPPELPDPPDVPRAPAAAPRPPLPGRALLGVPAPELPPTPRVAETPRAPRAPRAPGVPSLPALPAPGARGWTSWTGTIEISDSDAVIAGIPGFGPGCGDDTTDLRMQARDGDLDLRLDRGSCRLDLELEGDVTFTADETAVATIGRGARLAIETRTGGVRRELDVVRGDDGRPRTTFRVDGEPAPAEEGRRWLAGMVPLVYRLSGIDAEARVGRLLTGGGIDAVLAEVRAIPFDSVQRTYLAEAARQGSPDARETGRLLVVAGAELGSDYELAELLLAVEDAGLVRDEATAADYAAATRTLGSDYELRRALQPVVAGWPAPAVLDTALEAAETIGSDYELAELLIAVARAYPDGRELPASFVDALATIGSDYEHRRVLEAFLDHGVPAPAVLDRVLATVGEIGSDFEAAELLVRLAALYPAERALPAAFFTAAEGVTSDFEMARVLTAVVARGTLPEATLVATLEAARSIDSDHELGTLLARVAGGQRLAGAAAAAFDRALATVGSGYERERIERLADRSR